MKICENCGMEYGDDNPFCPFCDERYGVVILADDVISADGLPAYKEEFPVIGETGVKQESFAANRDEIFERNTRLAEIENFMPKVGVKKVYKPVMPLAEVDRNGEIIPYKPTNPIIKKFNNIRKNIKDKKIIGNFKKSLCVLAGIYVFLILLILGMSRFETVDNTYIYNETVVQQTSTVQEITYVYDETAVQQTVIRSETAYSGNGEVPAVKTAVPEEITITSENGLEMKLTIQSKAEYFAYSFEFTNTTDRDLDSFYDEFAGAEYMDKVYAMWITASNGNSIMHFISWEDGIPHTDQPYTVRPNETIYGTITFDFRDKD
ncbi:MAG: hypothetical protein HDT25_08745 [Ruminococcus sp.]|nr:hypothetical protein [Ruminococcus sp.]